jgi:hypothetical protein
VLSRRSFGRRLPSVTSINAARPPAEDAPVMIVAAAVKHVGHMASSSKALRRLARAVERLYLEDERGGVASTPPGLWAISRELFPSAGTVLRHGEHQAEVGESLISTIEHDSILSNDRSAGMRVGSAIDRWRRP